MGPEYCKQCTRFTPHVGGECCICADARKAANPEVPFRTMSAEESAVRRELHSLRLFEKTFQATRRVLWREVVGHPEHHSSWTCQACDSLRARIKRIEEAYDRGDKTEAGHPA